MSKKYVLIVDDDPDLVETVSMMLESKGLRGGEGLRRDRRARKPSRNAVRTCLILDVMMPRKNGYQLCKELKSNKWTQDIPIVLLTAVGEAVPTTTYSHAEGMAIEAEDFIPKPVDAKTLVEAVERLL